MSDVKHTDKRTKTHACVCERTETHGDLISRKAAIDAMTHKWDGMVTSVFDVLKELPSAEPQWILCSEKLPEDGTEVFVYLFNRPSPYIAWIEDCRWYADCISRSAAIKAARRHEVELPLYAPKETDIFWNDAIDIICDELESLPSAEPERKKGEWIVDGDCEGKSRTVTCNLCGHEEFNWHNPNFCPNCGARMIIDPVCK